MEVAGGGGGGWGGGCLRACSPSLENFLNFTPVRMDLVASKGSVKWLLRYRDFCANSIIIDVLQLQAV